MEAIKSSKKKPIIKKNDNNTDPIHIIQAFMRSEFAGVVLQFGTSINQFIESIADRQIQKSEIEKKELSNKLEIEKIKLQSYEIERQFVKDQQKFIQGFDWRNKLYSILLLVILLGFLLLLFKFDIVDKQMVVLFFTLISTAIAVANKDILSNLINTKSATISKRIKSYDEESEE